MTAEHHVPPPPGVTIERTYRDKIRHQIVHGVDLGLRKVVVCNGEGRYDDRFGDLICEARSRGIVSQQDQDEIWNQHTTVFRGEKRNDGSLAYAVVDVAVSVQDSHIEEVAERASILCRITRHPVIGAMVGAFIVDASFRQLAQERRVRLINASMDGAKMYRYVQKEVLEEFCMGKLQL